MLFETAGESFCADVLFLADEHYRVTLSGSVWEVSGSNETWAELEAGTVSVHRFEARVAEGGTPNDSSTASMSAMSSMTSIPSLTATAVQKAGDLTLFVGGEVYRLACAIQGVRTLDERETAGAIVTPMPGKIIQVSVGVGDRVNEGQSLIVLEAMKMEHIVCAPVDAAVESLEVGVGDQVEEGKVLLVLAQAD
jgi:acetyl/propionyl-CoA carboxylase alpha subunit